MSWKIYFLYAHLNNFLPENNGTVSDKHADYFQQETTKFEKFYEVNVHHLRLQTFVVFRERTLAICQLIYFNKNTIYQVKI